MSQNSVILVTGMSGAGRSFTLKTLEDVGHETVDNLPLPFLSLMINSETSLLPPIAIGIDVRTHDFSVQRFLEQVKKLQILKSISLKIIFCDCDDDVLIRRYTETRRKHPLSSGRPIIDDIRTERLILKPILDIATHVIDTSHLSTTETRHIVKHQFSIEKDLQMFVQIISFGYKYGVPREADMILDARCLQNPFYDDQLRPFSGEDDCVARFIEKDLLTKPFLDQIKGLLSLILPKFDQEGRSYLTLAFGCTGGQHRSVYCSSIIFEWLRTFRDQVNLYHRDKKSNKK